MAIESALTTSYEINIVLKIIFVYVAFFVVELLNKIGHFPKNGIRFEAIFPLPKAIAYGSRERYGGMIFMWLIAGFVWFYKPGIVLLQIIGLVAWVLFITQAILGSMNFEIPIPRKLIGKIVSEEIPNELWYIFVPAAIITFLLFCCYYLDVANLFFGTNLPINIGFG